MRRQRKEAIIQAAKKYLSSFPERDWKYEIVDNEVEGSVLLVSRKGKNAYIAFLLSRYDGKCTNYAMHFFPELTPTDQMMNDIAATEWILSNPDFIS